MGSAEIQGRLWGAQSKDWSQLLEPTAVPLFNSVLDAARVTAGTRLLDAGCGSGLAALLGSLRGAEVAAIDASASLLDIARSRLPDADIRQADLEDLPFADGSFDAVIGVNSVFYAADPPAALRELARVTRPGGRVVITSWGRADQCEYASVARAMGALMPPPPPGAPLGGPFALAEPGVIEAMLAEAGLTLAGRGEVACPFIFVNADASRRGQLSSGIAQRAVEHSGEAAVLNVIDENNLAHTHPDGSIHYENVFVWVAGVRQ